MIQYALRCAKGHAFNSWFQSAAAYDALRAAGHLTCAVCGSRDVGKAPMAPRVQQSDSQSPARQKETDAAKALAEMRKHVEENSDYVGRDFAQEARAQHLGDAPARPIWGEARGDEAKALVEDGVPIAPLPFMPTRKTN